MKTNAYHRFHTSLLALGMILAVCFAAIRPEAAYASVLPATTCTEASGTRTCDLWATTGTLTLPGGTNVTIWGYASDGLSPAGLPGPTLVATEGETLAIVLHNGLSEATSLSIPGFLESADMVGVGAGGTKTYTYSGLQPGTYLYQAGPTANGERQIAMGLYGLLIVRPSGAPQQAYGPDSAFDDESILVMSEIDPALNAAPTSFDLQAFSPKYFLFNGKAYPDTTPIDTDAGRKVLLRVANAGLQNHSLGVLGLHYSVLSSDGRPFAHPHFAVAETLSAGQTADVLVQIPADAPSGMKYAVYDSNLRLLNNGQPFGGMLTFLSIPTNPTGTDTTGPTSTGLSLSPNPSNGSVAVAFSLTVSDTDSGSNNITAVEYFIDTAGANGTGVPMDPQDGTFDSPSETATASIIPTSLSAGVHTVYVHGQDAAGNWGPVNTIQLNLDKQGPVSSGLTSTPSPSNGTVSIALSGSANDSASGNSNVNAAEYFIDAAGADGSGTAMSLNQTAPIVSITGTIPSAVMNTLSEGYHTVFVHSRDALGNWGAFATLQLSVDKTGPAAGSILLRPNPNNGSLPYTPSIQSVRLDATFTEPGGGPVTSSVKNAEFFIDTVGANGTGILMTPTDGSFNSTTETGYAYIPLVTVKALSNGPHVISIHGKDAAGNWGPFSTVTLVIDKLAPTVSGVTLTPAITNNTAVAISASASDTATGNNNVSAAEYYIDTTVAAGTGTPMTVNAASPTVSLTATLSATTLSALTEGTHAIYVRAKDIAGNWSDAVKANLIVDRTGPTFTGITLTPNSIVVGAASVNLTVNGSSDGATGSGVTGGEYWFGATDIAAGTGTAFSGTSAVIPTNSLAVGTYTVRVRIRDAAGNWSNGVGGVRTATLTIIPPPPLLYFSTFGNSNPPGVSGTADDADIYYFNNGSAFSRVIDSSGTGSLLGLSSFANVDGFDRVDATHFYLSFADAVNIPTLGTVQDEDVVYYNAGIWSLFFDGSVNGVGATDLDAISIVGGTLYFSTDNTLVPPGSGGSGDDADIYRWNGGSSYTRIFDASALGWSTANVDGFARVDATHFYVSYSVDTTVPGLGTVQDEDVLYYNNGVWTVYFDGTGYGLTSNNLDIDAFDLP